MQEQLEPAGRQFWNAGFPGGQIEFPDLSSLGVKVLDGDDLTIGLEGHVLHAVPVGHSDTDETSVLWVPDLKLVVTGDVVSFCYPFLIDFVFVGQIWLTSIYNLGV